MTRTEFEQVMDEIRTEYHLNQLGPATMDRYWELLAGELTNVSPDALREAVPLIFSVPFEGWPPTALMLAAVWHIRPDLNPLHNTIKA